MLPQPGTVGAATAEAAGPSAVSCCQLASNAFADMFHTQMNQDWHGPQVWGQGGWAAAGRFDFWVVWAKTMGQSGLSSHPWAHFHWVLASFQPFLTAWPAVAPQPSKTQWATPGPRGLWASHSWPQTGHDWATALCNIVCPPTPPTRHVGLLWNLAFRAL